jgi:hypothetical protein
MQRDQSYPKFIGDGEYKLIQFLGKGAQGEVCLYEEVANGEFWAIRFDIIG